MQWFSGLLGEQKSTPGNSSGFQVGEVVEYYSPNNGGWIPAKVVAKTHDGLYDLDCKPAVSSDMIRIAATFEPGMIVEYWSESMRSWILAKVINFDTATGTYNLDCKPNVPVSKIRHTSQEPIAPGLGTDTRSTVPLTSAGALPAPTFGPPHTSADNGASSYAAPARIPATSSTFSPFSRAPVGSIPAQDRPLQLIRVFREGGDWKFAVNDEAAQVLEAYGNRKVSICTVCGPYRTGKSYLLNLLLGRIQRGESQFRVGSTTRACTEGLWMWGKKEELSADGSTLIYMDCEGFGSTESDKTRDAKLMSLCLLLSSVFLLNTKGVLSESLFNALSLVCHLAQHIEERGQESTKPALLWLLRDFVLELQDQSGSTISADQYLETSLNAQPLASTDAERSRAAREVRDCLKRFFPERHCATLVQPVIEENRLQQLSELPYTELRMEFRRELEAMQNQIGNLARKNPKLVAGQPIGGAALVMMLRKLVQSLNSNQALNVKSAWENVQHSACTALIEELREGAIAELRKVSNGGPMPGPGGQPLPVRDDILDQALKQGRRDLRNAFAERAVGDEAVRVEYWKELKESIQMHEENVRRQNRQIAEQQLRDAAMNWESWINSESEATSSDPRSDALLKLLDKGMPGQPVCKVAREALSAARLSHLKWDGRLKNSKTENKMLSDELESKKQNARQIAEAASKGNDQAMEHTREIGRLQGQIDSFQTQAREAMNREQELKEKLLVAEQSCQEAKEKLTDAEQNYQRMKDRHDEVFEKCGEHVQTIKRMQREQKSKADDQDTAPAAKPKCCVIS